MIIIYTVITIIVVESFITIMTTTIIITSIITIIISMIISTITIIIHRCHVCRTLGFQSPSAAALLGMHPCSAFLRAPRPGLGFRV